jgi:hypothetical protein
MLVWTAPPETSTCPEGSKICAWRKHSVTMEHEVKLHENGGAVRWAAHASSDCVARYYSHCIGLCVGIFTPLANFGNHLKQVGPPCDLHDPNSMISA